MKGRCIVNRARSEKRVTRRLAMILVGETSKKSDKMPRRLSQKKKPDVNMNNDLHKVTEGAFRNENRCVSHGVGRMN